MYVIFYHFLKIFLRFPVPILYQILQKSMIYQFDHFSKLNDPELIRLLKSIAPDLIISSQGHYLSRQILKIPKYGCIATNMLAYYQNIEVHIQYFGLC